jgi:hypothetical protein
MAASAKAAMFQHRVVLLMTVQGLIVIRRTDGPFACAANHGSGWC